MISQFIRGDKPGHLNRPREVIFVNLGIGKENQTLEHLLKHSNQTSFSKFRIELSFIQLRELHDSRVRAKEIAEGTTRTRTCLSNTTTKVGDVGGK